MHFLPPAYDWRNSHISLVYDTDKWSGLMQQAEKLLTSLYFGSVYHFKHLLFQRFVGS